MTRGTQARWALLLPMLLGCTEEKKTPPAPAAKAEVEETAPPPKKLDEPLRLQIDDAGPSVGYARVVLGAADGRVTPLGLDQLRKELALERERIAGKNLVLDVDRRAKSTFVAALLAELFALGPGGVEVATESRAEFPKRLPFGPARRSTVDGCSVVGAITKERASAIWKVSGTTARKQAKGMGGPDLTIAAETIVATTKGCGSDVFVVGGSPEVEWGLVYDLAAAGLSAPSSPLKRAAISTEPLTLGRPVELAP